tara:strand:+ start:3634 stop:4419 length:786 start_codon:yes stop_codon:yes gene_type:complete
MKLPAIQFYIGDWLRDPVSGCSLEAQGLWLRIMFVMHDNEEYGRLSVNGKPMPDNLLARRCGCSPDEFSKIFSELEEAGVPSRDDSGVLFSRRMVRDAGARASNRERVARHRAANNPNPEPKAARTQSRRKAARPRSLDDVTAYASIQGLAEAEAKAFWDHYESQGWVKSNGMPVANWKSLMNTWKRRGEANKHSQSNGAQSVWSLREQEKEIAAEIERVKTRGSEDWRTGKQTFRTQQDADLYTSLRAKLKTVKAKILKA